MPICIKWTIPYYHLSRPTDSCRQVKRSADHTIFFEGDSKTPERLLFYGTQNLNENETHLVGEFQKHVGTLPQEDIESCKLFNDKEKLRFIIASKEKLNETVTEMKKYVKWRKDYLPLKLNESLVKILNSRYLIVNGRDIFFRPIIQFDLVILGKLIKSGFPVEDLSKVGVFVMEHIIHYMLLDGQVENWVVLVDVQKQSLSEIPIGAFGNVLKMFSMAYKSRTAKIFIVNTTMFTYTLWKAIQFFLDKGTRLKIVVTTESFPDEMKALIHPSQLPEAVGGWAKPPEKSWPPLMLNRDFMNDTKALLSEDEYKKVLAATARMVPSPEFAYELAETRETVDRCEKEYYFKDKIVRVNCYNKLLSVKDYI